MPAASVHQRTRRPPALPLGRSIPPHQVTGSKGMGLLKKPSESSCHLASNSLSTWHRWFHKSVAAIGGCDDCRALPWGPMARPPIPEHRSAQEPQEVPCRPPQRAPSRCPPRTLNHQVADRPRLSPGVAARAESHEEDCEESDGAGVSRHELPQLERDCRGIHPAQRLQGDHAMTPCTAARACMLHVHVHVHACACACTAPARHLHGT